MYNINIKIGFVLLESKEACVDVNECTQQETLDYCGGVLIKGRPGLILPICNHHHLNMM